MGNLLVGVNSAGTDADNFTAGDNTANKFTAGASGSGVVIRAQTKVANPGFSAFQLGVYADDTGFSPSHPGVQLAVQAADSLAVAQGTGVITATLGSPVTIVSGTVYWLVWYAAGEQFDYLGTLGGGSYWQKAGVPTAPYGAPASGPWGHLAIIWVEDAGIPEPNIDMGGYGPIGM